MPQVIPQSASLFRLLSNPTRLKILAALATNGPATVESLVATLAVKQPLVSLYMGHLVANGLVKREQVGRYKVLFSLAGDGPADGVLRFEGEGVKVEIDCREKVEV